MKVLVTGGGGFLGGELIRRLVAENHEVTGLYRTTCHFDWDTDNKVHLVKGNLLDKDSLYEAVKGCEQIYHVGALSKSWSKDPSLFYKVNVLGTINLIEVAKELGVKRIVVTSSAGAIGPAEKGKMVSENQCRLVDFFGDYESSKFIMNEKIQDYVRDGMDIRIVCPTRVFGPGNLSTDGSIVTKMIKKYLEGTWRVKLGKGDDLGNYAFIDDVVQGHVLAMKNGKSGEKYLIGSFNDTFNGILQTVDEIAQKKRKLIGIPFGLIWFYATFVGKLAAVFNFNPLITVAWTRKLRQNWETDLSKAINELGYKPTPEKVAIEKTINWIKEKQK